MKKVFLDDLPVSKNERINWKRCVGYNVKFIYEDIKGEVEIVGYNKGKLELKYKNKTSTIRTQHFRNGRLGGVLGVVRLSKDYKHPVGSILDNIDSGKLLILEHVRIGSKKYKGYRYECLVCGNVDRISESHLTTEKKGCNVCGGIKTLQGYNDIWTTNPWLGSLFWNSEDGYDYQSGSGKRVDFKCPDCESKIRNKIIKNVFNHGLFCPQCSDGLSYPEKFLFNVLTQATVSFDFQKTFDWSKSYKHENPKLCGHKRYDFYLSTFDKTLEVHGAQHYKDSGWGRLSLEDEKENDRIKKYLSTNNTSGHIIIDAQVSSLEYIKNSILDSELATLVDLSKVNWLKCHEHACNSLIKTACDLWSERVKSTAKIGEIMKLDRHTIVRYLKKGAMINWCDYNPDCEKQKGMHIENIVRSLGKRVVQLKVNGEFVREYESMSEARRVSKTDHISEVCNGKRKTAGGFKWMYKEDYEN